MLSMVAYLRLLRYCQRHSNSCPFYPAAAAAPRPPWLPPQTEQRHPAIAIGFMRGEAICAGRHGEGMNLRHHDVRQRQIKAAAPSLAVAAALAAAAAAAAPPRAGPRPRTGPAINHHHHDHVLFSGFKF